MCGGVDGAPGPAPTWKTELTGRALELKAAVDGSVVVRFAEEPWLVRYAAYDGQASPLDLQAGLSWASAFVIAADGSLYVAGTTRLDGSTVRVDHLSATGELLASSMPSPELIEFDALALGPDGKVYLVAESSDGRRLVTLDAAAGQEAALLMETAALVGQERLDLDTPRRLAFAADGGVLLQGGADTLWVQKLELTPELARTRWAQESASNFARGSVYAGGVFGTPDGGALLGVGTGWTNAASLLGTYRRSVDRIAADGRFTWSSGDSFMPRDPEPDVIRHTSICPLADSVILANLTGVDARVGSAGDATLLDSATPAATVARYTMAGALAQSLVLPGVVDVVAAGPTSAVFLSAAQLARLRLAGTGGDRGARRRWLQREQRLCEAGRAVPVRAKASSASAAPSPSAHRATCAWRTRAATAPVSGASRRAAKASAVNSAAAVERSPQGCVLRGRLVSGSLR